MRGVHTAGKTKRTKGKASLMSERMIDYVMYICVIVTAWCAWQGKRHVLQVVERVVPAKWNLEHASSMLETACLPVGQCVQVIAVQCLEV